jgi:hypothetical protein
VQIAIEAALDEVVDLPLILLNNMAVEEGVDVEIIVDVAEVHVEEMLIIIQPQPHTYLLLNGMQ